MTLSNINNLLLMALLSLSIVSCGGGSSSTISTGLPDHPIFNRAVVSASPSYSPSGDTIDTTPTFSWKAIDNATVYYLGHQDVETDTNWHEYIIPASQADCNSITYMCSYTPDNFSFSIGDKKVWWITAKVSGHWQAWSRPHVFNIIKNPVVDVAAPKTIAPKGSITTLAPTFTWSAIADASQYQLGIENTYPSGNWKDYIISATQAACENTTHDCSYTPGNPDFVVGNKKTWWVRAKVNGRWGQWSKDTDITIVNNTVPDTVKPVISLKGKSLINLKVGASYTDAGATAADNKDGNITNKIIVNNSVNTNKIGTYFITYNVSDSKGNKAEQVTRKVVVAQNFYYVSTQGNNTNNGFTENKSWATLQYAVSQLKAGDLLYVRGGSYHESHVNITAKGTANKPIRIKAYPGEKPILDGRKSEFLKTNNTSWEVVNIQKNIFRSTAKYDDGWNAYGFLEENGNFYHLVTYKSYEALISDTQLWTSDGTSYVGPGIYWDNEEKRIYVRLSRPSQEATSQTFDLSDSLDPRKTKLHIGLKERGLIFNNAEYITVDGLNIYAYEETARVFTGNHINFKNMELLVGQYGIILSDTAGFDYLIDNVTFRMHLPDWIAWADMKIEPKPAGNIKLTSMSITGSQIEIKNSKFIDTHDAITASGHDIYVHHNYMETEDDAIQLGSSSYNTEFSYNKVIGPGPSHDGDNINNPFPGTTYIHHNIIDASKPIFWARKDPTHTIDGKYTKNPIKPHNIFGSHGTCVTGNPWKIYNNTLIGSSKVSYTDHGYTQWCKNTTGVKHEVYNNIILLKEDWIFYRGWEKFDNNDIYDGNQYWRPESSVQPFYYNLITGTTPKNYKTLADFKTSPDFATTGWELNGIVADPKLDNNYRPSSSNPAAKGAINLKNRGWPGADGAVYRGALKPHI